MQLVLCVIMATLYVIFMPLYLWRRNVEPIKSRGWELSSVQMTLSMLDMVLRTVAQPLIPCWFEQYRTLLVITYWAYPYITRAYTLW